MNFAGNSLSPQISLAIHIRSNEVFDLKPEELDQRQDKIFAH
jgi:hypothetical protein